LATIRKKLVHIWQIYTIISLF